MTATTKITAAFVTYKQQKFLSPMSGDEEAQGEQICFMCVPVCFLNGCPLTVTLHCKRDRGCLGLPLHKDADLNPTSRSHLLSQAIPSNTFTLSFRIGVTGSSPACLVFYPASVCCIFWKENRTQKEFQLWPMSAPLSCNWISTY